MGQYGFSRKFGFTPPKVPAANHAGSAGTQVSAAPPSGSFDPSLESKRRAAHRGEHDKLQDINREHHFDETDLNQALRDIHTTVARKRQDLGINFNRNTQKLATDYERGGERIGNEEADTKLKAERTKADFATKLADIGRQFGELGHRQGEAANAAGVNDAGTSAAAAAARARNQQISEAPIHTAEGRLNEDLYTALTRLGTSRGHLTQDRDTASGQLTQDYGIANSQLKQDRDRERRGVHKDFNRKYGPGYDGGKGYLGTAGIERERTKREGIAANADLLEQEIYESRRNYPGGYVPPGKKKGKR